MNLIRVMPAKGLDSGMQTSIYLAKLIGPVALVGGVAVLMNAATFRALALEFLRSPALIYLSGLLTMTAGVAVVLAHNVWVANWPLIITVFGWAAAIGGAVRIAFPDRVKSIGASIIDKPMAMTVGGLIWIAFGAVLSFFGYFA